MRTTFEWTESEWEQAVRVATRKSARGTPLPGMIYALVGIPLLGAVGDLITLARLPGRITLAGSVVPLLLVLFATTSAALLGLSRVKRRRQRNSVSPMPVGLREMVLQESGWRFNALVLQAHDAASDGAALRPWGELLEARQGSDVIVLVHNNGFEAVPTKSLTPEQAGHLHRLIMRKIRPTL